MVLQELCENPEAFSRVDERGWYPLHWASVQPVVSVLEMVLYGGSQVHFRLKLGITEKLSESVIDFISLSNMFAISILQTDAGRNNTGGRNLPHICG